MSEPHDAQYLREKLQDIVLEEQIPTIAVVPASQRHVCGVEISPASFIIHIAVVPASGTRIVCMASPPFSSRHHS